MCAAGPAAVIAVEVEMVDIVVVVVLWSWHQRADQELCGVNCGLRLFNQRTGYGCETNCVKPSKSMPVYTKNTHTIFSPEQQRAYF